MNYSMAKFGLAIFVISIVSLITLTPSQAEQGAVETVVNFTTGTVGEVVDYAVDTAQNLGDAVVGVVENTGDGLNDLGDTAGQVFTGDVTKAPDLLTEPVANTIDSSQELVEDVATAPFTER